ncbi:hypothetical protein [Streptomyces sp. NPDC002044]|uniref:hypothetical protein n=1 Tax=Streptomyces sp. NPDC002044 TaxID=3154662 RepID=UPI00332B5C94
MSEPDSGTQPEEEPPESAGAEEERQKAEAKRRRKTRRKRAGIRVTAAVVLGVLGGAAHEFGGDLYDKTANSVRQSP